MKCAMLVGAGRRLPDAHTKTNTGSALLQRTSILFNADSIVMQHLSPDAAVNFEQHQDHGQAVWTIETRPKLPANSETWIRMD